MASTADGSDQAGNGDGTALSAQAYVHALTPIMAAVTAQIDGPIQEAADLVATSLRADGVIQAFGSGHSEALAMEIAGRAGGLIATNRIALRDLVLLGGESTELLRGGELERDPSYSRKLYELSAARPGDLFVIASNSGVNGSIVELASVVKEKGHPLIAITSLQHTSGVDSRHPSGKKLIDFADVVLDNHAPYGDSVLDLPDWWQGLRRVVHHCRADRADAGRGGSAPADRGRRQATGLPVREHPGRRRPQPRP